MLCYCWLLRVSAQPSARTELTMPWLEAGWLPVAPQKRLPSVNAGTRLFIPGSDIEMDQRPANQRRRPQPTAL